jgi:hypothetical protein
VQAPAHGCHVSAAGRRVQSHAVGRAGPVEWVKTVLEAPATILFKLRCAEPLSNFAFKLNLRRYMSGNLTSRGWMKRSNLWNIVALQNQDGSWQGGAHCK